MSPISSIFLWTILTINLTQSVDIFLNFTSSHALKTGVKQVVTKKISSTQYVFVYFNDSTVVKYNKNMVQQSSYSLGTTSLKTFDVTLSYYIPIYCYYGVADSGNEILIAGPDLASKYSIKNYTNVKTVSILALSTIFSTIIYKNISTYDMLIYRQDTVFRYQNDGTASDLKNYTSPTATTRNLVEKVIRVQTSTNMYNIIFTANNQVHLITAILKYWTQFYQYHTFQTNEKVMDLWKVSNLSIINHVTDKKEIVIVQFSDGSLSAFYFVNGTEVAISGDVRSMVNGSLLRAVAPGSTKDGERVFVFNDKSLRVILSNHTYTLSSMGQPSFPLTTWTGLTQLSTSPCSFVYTKTSAQIYSYCYTTTPLLLLTHCIFNETCPLTNCQLCDTNRTKCVTCVDGFVAVEGVCEAVVAGCAVDRCVTCLGAGVCGECEYGYEVGVAGGECVVVNNTTATNSSNTTSNATTNSTNNAASNITSNSTSNSTSNTTVNSTTTDNNTTTDNSTGISNTSTTSNSSNTISNTTDSSNTANSSSNITSNSTEPDPPSPLSINDTSPSSPEINTTTNSSTIDPGNTTLANGTDASGNGTNDNIMTNGTDNGVNYSSGIDDSNVTGSNVTDNTTAGGNTTTDNATNITSDIPAANITTNITNDIPTNVTNDIPTTNISDNQTNNQSNTTYPANQTNITNQTNSNTTITQPTTNTTLPNDQNSDSNSNAAINSLQPDSENSNTGQDSIADVIINKTKEEYFTKDMIQETYDAWDPSVQDFNVFSSKINSLPASRNLLLFLTPIFSFLDDYWYYIYHQDSYPQLQIFPQFLVFMYNANKDRILSDYVKFDTPVDISWGNNQQYRSYTDGVIMEIDQKETHFLEDVEPLVLQQWVFLAVLVVIVKVVTFLMRMCLGQVTTGKNRKEPNIKHKARLNTKTTTQPQQQQSSPHQQPQDPHPILSAILSYLQELTTFKSILIMSIGSNMIFLSFTFGSQLRILFRFDGSDMTNVIIAVVGGFVLGGFVLVGLLYEDREDGGKQKQKELRKERANNRIFNGRRMRSRSRSPFHPSPSSPPFPQQSQRLFFTYFINLKNLLNGLIHGFFIASPTTQYLLLILIKASLIVITLNKKHILRKPIFQFLIFIYFFSGIVMDVMCLLSRNLLIPCGLQEKGVVFGRLSVVNLVEVGCLGLFVLSLMLQVWFEFYYNVTETFCTRSSNQRDSSSSFSSPRRPNTIFAVLSRILPINPYDSQTHITTNPTTTHFHQKPQPETATSLKKSRTTTNHNTNQNEDQFISDIIKRFQIREKEKKTEKQLRFDIVDDGMLVRRRKGRNNNMVRIIKTHIQVMGENDQQSAIRGMRVKFTKKQHDLQQQPQPLPSHPPTHQIPQNPTPSLQPHPTSTPFPINPLPTSSNPPSLSQSSQKHIHFPTYKTSMPKKPRTHHLQTIVRNDHDDESLEFQMEDVLVGFVGGWVKGGGGVEDAESKE